MTAIHSDSQGPCFLSCPNKLFRMSTNLLGITSGSCTITIDNIDDYVDVSVGGQSKRISGTHLDPGFKPGSGTITFNVEENKVYYLNMDLMNIMYGGSLRVILCNNVKPYKSNNVRKGCN